MDYTAIILAGGRSSRLGGVPKASLAAASGRTLLEHALDAAAGASARVVVGPPPGRPLPDGVLLAREEPAFAGPAAALAAGLAAVPAAEFTLVLACDMPRSASGVAALLEAAAGSAGDGVILADDGGRVQPLAALYRTDPLRRQVAQAAARGRLENGSVFALVASLELVTVPAPAGSTDDVDTWADAQALGVAPLPAEPGTAANDLTKGRLMKSQEETLEEWCRAVLKTLELEDVDVDINAVLKLAGVAAHAVVRPAAPLTTFLAGLAAGMAAGSGQADEHTAMRSAIAVCQQLARDYSDGEAAPAGPGPR
ncbi:NTP transferase domain-containing protein [Paenarthrobacter sp. DKR-5]|uniref:NTP transferase domain-containing protein n=1 Tax=Paenarthrobacter sp. DKR-5 TaxID=2835535 RepID=UPI001BDD5949|nr:NTP transferase domain-containing protein [Paenarthrobacter sp. DKR-5]MBT1004165.1 NTP transferase domain-containing protein [Paenarthrobacter sp. DKR-5]